MARVRDNVRTLGKVLGVNLEKRMAECATSMNAKVTANFYDSQSDLLTVPSVGEIWELELKNGRWFLDRRNDWESPLHRAYEKKRKDGSLGHGDTFLISEGNLVIEDKHGSLFDETGKISPNRVSGGITTTTVIDARVKNFGSNATVTIEWPLANPSKQGTGPGEQGISYVGAIVKAIVDTGDNVLWVGLPATAPSQGDGSFPIGSGGKYLDDLQDSLGELDTSLERNRETLDQLELDLAQNDLDLEEARLLAERAREDVEALEQMVAEVEETVTINSGKNTYSVHYPETEDGAGKPINAMWQVMDEDGKTLKETYIWNGTAWLPYGYGLDSLDQELQDRLQQADEDLSQLVQDLERAEDLLNELDEGFGTVEDKADQATLDAREAHNAAVEAQEKADNAVVGTVTEYAVGTSDSVAPTTGWDDTQPARVPGSYVWLRTRVTYGSGDEEVTAPALLTGNDGTPAVLLRIDSSRGTAFKNNMIATVLSVTIFFGDKQINNIDDLHDTIGPGFYLEWLWRRIDDEEFGLISSSDDRLGNAGFTLTVSPDDVDEQTVFQCVLKK